MQYIYKHNYKIVEVKAYLIGLKKLSSINEQIAKQIVVYLGLRHPIQIYISSWVNSNPVSVLLLLSQ